jgi:U3 small nucleolar ribonucleoprotein component
MKLKDLMVDTKTAWLDFPGAPGFEVQVANLSRKELVALRKRCIQQKFDRKTRQMVEELDEEKFVAEFTKDTVKNWRGLKLKYLEDLLLVDLKGQDLEAKLDYDEEQAQVLVQNSTEFDNWINEVVFDLANFRRAGAGEPLDALRGVANS